VAVTSRPSSTELRCTVRVGNAQGLHARPCHAVAARALSFQSELRIRARGREVNGKSILELMTLTAGPGTELELVARGPDAEALLAALQEIFEGCFGEEREERR
jgi:phosphotransferase system HPr (HPr) family protein